MSQKREKDRGRTRSRSKGALGRKTATTKTAPKTGPDEWTHRAPPPPQGGASLPLGAHPGNTGGKAGRSGRPGKEWGAFCLSALRREVTQKEIERRLGDSKAREYAALVKVVAAYGVGEPPKKVRLTGLLAVANKLQGKSLEELKAMESLTVDQLLDLFEQEDTEEEEEGQ